MIGESLNRRPASLRFANHADDLRQKRIAADPLGSNHDASGAVYRSASHLATLCLLDRNRLAGDHRLIHGCRAFDNDSINGNFFARAHAQTIADLDAIKRHVLFRCRRRAEGARSWAQARTTL